MGKKKKKKVKKSKKAVTKDVPEISTRDEEQLNEQNERLSETLMEMQQEETKVHIEKSTSLDTTQMDTMRQSSTRQRDVDETSDNNSDFSTESDSSSGSYKAPTHLIERKWYENFFLHLLLLLQKTLICYRRNKLPFTVLVLYPIFSCLNIVYFNSRGPVMQEMSEHRLIESHDMPPVKKCIGQDCISIGYSILGESDPEKQEQYNWIDDIMKSVARQNDMVYQKDVKKLTVGTPTHFYDYLKANPNTTTYSILWCTDQFEIFPQLSIPCTFKNQSLHEEENDKNMIFYTLYYNRSLQDIYLFKPTFLPAPSNGEII